MNEEKLEKIPQKSVPLFSVLILIVLGLGLFAAQWFFAISVSSDDWAFMSGVGVIFITAGTSLASLSWRISDFCRPSDFCR